MKKQFTYLNHQKGVVLFIALMALVVMSIAGVALIRNVDTNTTIAGNLSFQQSALTSSSRGVESAISWIQTQVNANPDAMQASSATNAYFATSGNLGANLNIEDRSVLKDDNTWDNYSVVATGAGITNGVEDDTKNEVNYIIERMCSDEGPADNPVDNSQNCLLGPSKAGGGSKGVKSAEQAGAKIEGALTAMYRITVRVKGLKNTQSYGQIYVY